MTEEQAKEVIELLEHILRQLRDISDTLRSISSRGVT
jgi:hypothetical protein